jgi:hypothetical protein
MATPLDSIIKQISIDLNDYATGYEFTTWSQEQLHAYVVEGLQIAFQYRPDLFVTREVFELQQGVFQTVCGSSKIYSILGVCDKDGHVLYHIHRRKFSERLMWTGRTFSDDPRRYKLRDYAVDTTSTNAFNVYPAVPAVTTIYCLLELSREPDNTVTEIRSELCAPVIQWALYRAKMVDSENNATIFSVAKEHQQTFYNLLQIQTQLQTISRNTDDAIATNTVKYSAYSANNR